MIHPSKLDDRVITRCSVLIALFLTVVATLLMAMTDGAAAGNIVVTSLADTQANNGACTLREAVINANNDNQAGSTDCAAGSGADTITFSVAGTITLGSGLSVVSEITIDGGNVITISGGNLVALFAVFCSQHFDEGELCPVGGSLTLRNLVVTEGSNDAILNGHRLTIVNSTVSGHSGVAIRNTDGAILTAVSSTFSNNLGLVISNEGGIRISNSTFVGNNVAIENDRSLHGTIISNSTFFGNRGGISNAGFSPTSVANSTFSNNGSAIFNSEGFLSVTNTIVASSTGSTGNCTNLSALAAVLFDGGNNIDDGTTCGFSAATNSKPNTDPLLDPAGLKNNGGPTATLALCTGVNSPSYGCTGPSPAIDTANNTACGNMDQRGFIRPVDGDFSGTATCDIGAVEVGVNFTVAPTSAVQGGSVNATWDNIGNPSATDWIGLYQVGAPNSPFWDWIYVSCSKTPTVARQFGSCVFPIPVPPNGTYELRLFSNNGFNLLGGSNPFTIGVTPTLPIVTVQPTTNAAEPNTNGLFTVSRSGSTANPLTVNYTVGGSATAGSDYSALSGAVTIPANALTAPIVVSPLDDPVYEGNESVAVTLTGNPAYALGNPSSATLLIVDDEIQPAGPSITVTPTTINRGGIVTVSWSGIVGPTPRDWIGLYQAGAPNSPFWDWEYVSCSKIPATAKASGTCTFRIPVNPPAGIFNLRLFSNDGFNLLAISNTFVLQ